MKQGREEDFLLFVKDKYGIIDPEPEVIDVGVSVEESQEMNANIEEMGQQNVQNEIQQSNSNENEETLTDTQASVEITPAPKNNEPTEVVSCSYQFVSLR